MEMELVTEKATLGIAGYRETEWKKSAGSWRQSSSRMAFHGVSCVEEWQRNTDSRAQPAARSGRVQDLLQRIHRPSLAAHDDQRRQIRYTGPTCEHDIAVDETKPVLPAVQDVEITVAIMEGRNLLSKNGQAPEMCLWRRRFRGARTPQVGHNDLSSASMQPAACLKSTN